MRLRHAARWLPLLAPAVALAFGGCGPAVPPGPAASPTPGPSATTGRTAACDARFASFDGDADGRWRPAETARWLYAYPLVPTYGPCPRPGATPPGRVVTQTGAADAAAGMVQPQCPLPADPGTIGSRLERAGDGAVSARAACARVGEQVACDDRFAAADADRDGGVSLVELRAATPAPPDNPLIGANPAPPEVVFQALDADADGRLTPAELCGFQRVTFALPTAEDLTGAWAFGTSGEPPAGPIFGECPPSNGLRLEEAQGQVTGEELVCGGPCYVPTTLAGSRVGDRLTLVGTVPPPAEAAGRQVTYDLRFDAGSGHLVGTRDGAPYWAAPYVRLAGEDPPCPL